MGLSESEFKPTVDGFNNIKIIDPNPVGQVVPHEDMIIYASLKARQKTKTVLTEDENSNLVIEPITPRNTIELISPQQTETIDNKLLFKTKPNLTTDWTEIGGTLKNVGTDFEGFGITNINIEIKSQTTPVVNIDFVDVRGATLFEQGSCSPYGLFFNLPYPIFELTLKGYYGRPVKYYLNLMNFTCKFNSSNGNMECSGKFIGYTFAFLSDMIVGYIAASQLLDEDKYKPQQILREKYKATKIHYNNQELDGEIDDISPFSPWCDNSAVGDNRCTTIMDLVKLINVFEKDNKSDIVKSPEFFELQNLESLQKLLTQYRDTVTNLINELQQKYPNSFENSEAYKDENIPPLKQKLVLTNPDLINELNKQDSGLLYGFFNKRNGTFLNLVKSILTKKITNNNVYGNTYTNCLSENFDIDYVKEIEGKNPEEQLYTYFYNLLDNKPFQYGILKEMSYADTSSKQTDKNGQTISFIDFGFIIKDIDNSLKILNNNSSDANQLGVITKKRLEVNKAINNVFSTTIGFKPSIRNVFTVILCNTETFIDILVNLQVKAEEYHEQNTKLTPGQADILSGYDKVYPWPTYIEKGYTPPSGSAKNQGEKEVYPGRRYPNWIECIFVEDFLKALKKFKEQIKIIENDTTGIGGYDNYVPINPLESPLWNENPTKYIDVHDKENTYRIIGERAFINLDHSYFSPIRITPDMLEMPLGIKRNTTNWNPIKNTDNGNDDIVSILGAMDAWNLLNSKDDGDKISLELNLIVKETTPEEFIKAVLNTDRLKKDGFNLTEKTASEISNLNTIISTGSTLGDSYGFGWDDIYYVLDAGNNGIKLDTKGNVVIHANPHKMDVNNLFKIIPAPNGSPENNPRKIEITNDKLVGQINNYSQKITEKTSFINFNTKSLDEATDYPTDINKITLDKNEKVGWFITSLDKPQQYITLAMSDVEEGNLTDWYKDTDISKLSVSNMGLLSYWDYEGLNQTLGISFLTDENDQDDVFISENNFDKLESFSDPKSKKIDPTDDIHGKISTTINGDGISTPFISTPLWLDNVNSFRTKTNGSKLKINSNGDPDSDDKFQYRNLAYLFLHTLKTTPLITRYTSDDGYLWDKSQATSASDNILSLGKSSDPALIQSLRAFMINGGMAKVPKAWLLTLGSELWRWKMFVGTKIINNTTVWNKPLTCKKCSKGDKPNGFDPLAQPGFNYNPSSGQYTNRIYKDKTFLLDKEEPIERNNIPVYLNKLYGISNSTFYVNNIQTSVFSNKYQERKKGQTLGDKGSDSDDYCSFRYYNIYRDKMGPLKDDLDSATPQSETSSYSWSQLWIAPHHIPYVNPEIFYDNDEGEASGFVMAFENGVDYMDYQTIMPVTYDNIEYYDGTSLSSGNDYTKRTRNYDGNLGMVTQYIPDEIKNKIIEEFEKWCDSEWKNTILPIVDPINFGSQTSNIFTNYQLKQDISVKTLGNDDSSYVLTLRDDESTSSLKKLLTDQYWLLSSTPKIWYGIGDDTQPGTDATTNQFKSIDSSQPFLVSKKILDTYLTSFYNEFTKQRDGRIVEINKKETESGVNNDSIINDDDIKLSLYRTFKSLSDKWISASNKGKSFFTLVNDGNNVCDGDYRYRGKTPNNEPQNNEPPKTLANNFQYVNRAMGDIGDVAVIDVTKLMEILDNPKLSLYQYITDLLVQNEYLFFPLPAYVNFTHSGLSDDALVDMFRPVNDLSTISCGPIFLSMYVGGTSRQLDLNSNNSNVSCKEDNDALKNINNDSFYLTGFGGNTPDEFTDTNISKKTTAFKVVYGIENQNHFRNIQLDQSDFKETAESLMVIDKLSQQGGSDRTTKGQNLNTAYLTRSYTCEIESFGNMMIQPMIYFDLIGIPMFSGSYLITEVKHNFKPNNSTTTFKGVRQPKMTVPIVTDVATAMNLSFKGDTSDGSGQSISEQSNTTSSGTVPRIDGSKNYAPIVRTLIENGSLNGKVQSGNINLKPIPPIKGVNNNKLNNTRENLLITEASDSLVVMMNDWVSWMIQEGFKGDNGIYAYITSVFRDYNKQVDIKKEYGDAAAEPGTSPHGWCIAVDIQMFRKDGTIIPNKKNQPQNFNINENPALKWLLDNSYSYGWVLPEKLRDGSPLEEHWHFEYHGTSAKCLVNNAPTVYGYTIKVDKPDKSIVINPKSKNGKTAVYTDCNYKKVDSGEGTEGNGTLGSKSSEKLKNIQKISYRLGYIGKV
jgi:hypothetical protein